MHAASQFAIVPASTPDLHRVRALAHAVWPEAYAGIIAADRIGPMLEAIYDLKALRADIEVHGHRYWIAMADGRDLGFASAFREADRLWIKKLYVLAAARGMGLGRALLATAVAAFPGATDMALYVNDGNAPAIGFYEAQGFVIERAEPVRMGPFDFTDYVMAKRL